MRLSDKVQNGSIEDVQNNLNKMADELEALCEKVYKKNLYSSTCRVLSMFALTTSEQLRMLSRLIYEPIEITANVCRSIFEMNIVLKFCLLNDKNLEDFATQRVTDEISIYKNVKKLGEADRSGKEIKILNDYIKELKSKLEKYSRPFKPDRYSIYQMAKEVGLQSEYDSLYGLYSKYVHASAWFVLGQRDHIDLESFRQIMVVHSQYYASMIWADIEEYYKK